MNAEYEIPESFVNSMNWQEGLDDTETWLASLKSTGCIMSANGLSPHQPFYYVFHGMKMNDSNVYDEYEKTF